MKTFFHKIHYGINKNILWGILLFFPSCIYFLIISVKNFLYVTGILKSEKVNAKVICVGNLTTGGVGKTPIVCEIANYLSSKGKKVAIISRGYQGKLNNKEVNLIKNYDKTIINDSYLAGDEALLISNNTIGCCVLTSRDRVLASNWAIKHLECDTIILDDGFSNRKLKKDLTILAIDNEKKFGNNFVLPLGPNREPLSAIKRADKILLINKANDCEVNWAEKFKKNIVVCKFKEDYYYNPQSQDVISIDFKELKQKVIAFCAIGQPQSFYDFLKKQFDLADTVTFEDHKRYSEKDIKAIVKKAKDLHANLIVTTEKDYVKLKNIKKEYKKDIYVLKLKPTLDIEALLDE